MNSVELHIFYCWFSKDQLRSLKHEIYQQQYYKYLVFFVLQCIKYTLVVIWQLIFYMRLFVCHLIACHEAEYRRINALFSKFFINWNLMEVFCLHLMLIIGHTGIKCILSRSEKIIKTHHLIFSYVEVAKKGSRSFYLSLFVVLESSKSTTFHKMWLLQQQQKNL